MIQKQDIVSALNAIGIRTGDDVIFHSSLKSFGHVEGGADAVIDAFLDAVGKEGTVIVPTLSMKNFSDAYTTWRIDKPSDTGTITEIFRQRTEALRSNQETHSVSSIGKKAKYFTETHGESGKRYGIYGSTPFSKDSPWQKMFDDNAKVVLVGVDFDKLTFRHLFEYTLVDEILTNANKKNKYDEAVKSICCFEERSKRCDTYFWPYISEKLSTFAKDNHFYKETKCGDSVLKCMEIKPFGDALLNDIRNNPDKWYEGNILKWFLEYK